MGLLSENGLSLERLAGFLEVAAAGSITLVAQGDPSRQALLSRQIKELETFFGVKLTRRVGRGLELTDAGQDLARRTREAFRLWEDYKEGYAGHKRRYRIGAAGSVLEWLLIPSLAQLKHERFELGIVGGTTNQLTHKLEDGELDFAILRDDALSPRLAGDVIGSYGYRLWAPRKLLPKGDHSPQSILEQLPLALPSGGSFRRKLSRELSSLGIVLKIGVETTSFTQALEALRTGSYAAILPEFAKTHLSEKRFATYAMPELNAIQRTLLLARRKQREDLETVSKGILEAIRTV